ncbi:MAG: Far upstream element-binding protein 3, partial [Paramarteilia canceri]
SSGSSNPHITKDLNVPGNLCGLIIGKNGETIKKLQAQTGVKIELIQDNSSKSTQHKPLRFTGYQDKVENAMETVKDYLITHGDIKLIASMLSTERDLITKHIKVPKIAIGAVIGRNGDTIRDIALLSNAK